MIAKTCTPYLTYRPGVRSNLMYVLYRILQCILCMYVRELRTTLYSVSFVYHMYVERWMELRMVSTI